MGVEPTTRLAKSRINGFEGHEDHRTPFASVRIIAGQEQTPARTKFVFVGLADQLQLHGKMTAEALRTPRKAQKRNAKDAEQNHEGTKAPGERQLLNCGSPSVKSK